MAIIWTVTAIFENGVFRPLQAIDLPSSTQVRITIELSPTETAKEEAWRKLQELWNTIKIESDEPRLTRDELHERGLGRPKTEQSS